ncbi:MAG TPA: sigma-70 family RNA polymerase sigma factor [Alphaproteobacteria bacterium]|nr:sigma-70 family RNA polymerase sigma factor [Alphaproteobacteria bacterium]
MSTDTGPGNAQIWGGLMAAAQSGDGASYERLLREILPYVRAIVRRHHAQPDRIEDVVQDVLLTIHRVRHTYDPARPFNNWLGAIAHRRSVDALRSRVRRDAVETFSPLAYETYADPGANKEIQGQEDGAVLKEALGTLPACQRQAVELLKLKEMSLVEASRASGQTVGALKVSLHRAIRTLQKRLGREGGHGDD